MSRMMQKIKRINHMHTMSITTHQQAHGKVRQLHIVCHAHYFHSFADRRWIVCWLSTQLSNNSLVSAVCLFSFSPQVGLIMMRSIASAASAILVIVVVFLLHLIHPCLLIHLIQKMTSLPIRVRIDHRMTMGFHVVSRW